MKKELGKRNAEMAHSLEAYGCVCGCSACTPCSCPCNSVHPDAMNSMASGTSAGISSTHSAESGRVSSIVFNPVRPQ